MHRAWAANWRGHTSNSTSTDRLLNLLEQALDPRNRLPLARRPADSGCKFRRDVFERHSRVRLRIRNDNRQAGISTGPDRGIDWDATQERNAKLLGRPLSPAMRKNFSPFATVPADEETHVLDDAQQWDIDLLEHISSPSARHRAPLPEGWSP